MPEHQHKASNCTLSNENKKNISHLFNSINYCFKCSAFIIYNSSLETKIKAIKPKIFRSQEENPNNPLWIALDNQNTYSFQNKKDYLKLRSPIIKNMKEICSFFSLSFKTFFTSIELLDKISSKLNFFDKTILIRISFFCIILACKFIENKQKALEVQTALKEKMSENYLIDEIYVLKLLDYDLNISTSYDVLMDILDYGFVFEDENFNFKKLCVLYYNIPKILYTFIECNSYLDMTRKQIAICIVGLCRELLDLNPFNDNIQKIFIIKENLQNIYISGLNIIKKRIKIQKKINDNQNYSNSNKEEV